MSHATALTKLILQRIAMGTWDSRWRQRPFDVNIPDSVLDHRYARGALVAPTSLLVFNVAAAPRQPTHVLQMPGVRQC